MRENIREIDANVDNLLKNVVHCCRIPVAHSSQSPTLLCAASGRLPLESVCSRQ